MRSWCGVSGSALRKFLAYCAGIPKAIFNAAVMARADYPALRRLLLDPPHRIDGIRYDILAERLERQDFDISEYEWTKNLAATHAWLARW